MYLKIFFGIVVTLKIQEMEIGWNIEEKNRLRVRSKHYDGFDKEQRGLCMCLNQFGR
jgi:hypothetical protein